MKVQDTLQLLEGDGAKTLFGRLYGENAVELNAVSYTHLDVYKRQVVYVDLMP